MVTVVKLCGLFVFTVFNNFVSDRDDFGVVIGSFKSVRENQKTILSKLTA